MTSKNDMIQLLKCQDFVIAPMRMKQKVVSVMDELTKASTAIETKFNAGVVNGFAKESFPQKVSKCFGGFTGAFSTNKLGLPIVWHILFVV